MRWKEDGDPAELMAPALATPMVTLGLLNCGVLVTLKTSPRICNCFGVSPFDRYRLRKSEKSMLCVPGPSIISRPALPKVYCAGMAKHAGLNHRLGDGLPSCQLQPGATFGR